MSTKRNSKRKNKGNESRLLLKRQQISGASLDGVNGGGESGALISGAVSGIYGASSSLDSPVAAVSVPVMGALSAYASNHIQDTIKKDSAKVEHAIAKGAKAVGSGISKAFHWLDPLSI